MTKTTAFIATVVLLFLAIGINTWLQIEDHNTAINALHNVSKNEHEGAVQRVTTISQRCELTEKLVEVLRKDDPQRVATFEMSYNKCIVGLHKAERLATKGVS